MTWNSDGVERDEREQRQHVLQQRAEIAARLAVRRSGRRAGCWRISCVREPASGAALSGTAAGVPVDFMTKPATRHSNGEEIEEMQRADRASCRSVSPRSEFTPPRSLERFDIPEGTRDHSAGRDFVHRLSGHFGRLGASQHPNGDAGGCEIGEGHRASARRRGAGGASRRPIRRGDDDRHWSLTRRTSRFDDQARTADQRASTGADGGARLSQRRRRAPE